MKIIKIFSSTIFLLIILFLFPGNSWSLTIIEDGKAQCVIVHSANAIDQEKSAAKDLQTYLEKISGAKPEIISEGSESNKIPIYIGNTNASQKQGLSDRVKNLKDDGYIIKVTSDSIYLTGKDPLATRFAVFGLLEDHLGVRWYMPGDIGEVVPHTSNVVLNEMEEVKEPSFQMRWIRSGDWALRNRMNVGVDSKLGFRISGTVHTFCELVPVDKYFDEHPEYFALVDGKRRRYPDPCMRNQLETANPDVIQLIIDKCLEKLESDPTLDMITIGPNDGLGFSESPESTALDGDYPISVKDINEKWDSLGEEKYGALSRRMTLFYKQVAEGILQELPEKYVRMTAYSAYRTPPGNLDIKAHGNVVVAITRGDCHDLPIESGSCNVVEGQRKSPHRSKRIPHLGPG